tara:strand:+ start:2381 stop:3511 length:1131 start_codon:yes stop_codon:yes gene_type:complete
MQHTNSININLKLFLFPLAFLPFLWDFYIFGVKIFDTFVFILALFCLIFFNINDLKKGSSRLYFFILFFIFFSFVGLINFGDIKGFIGLIFGIIYFYLITLFFKKDDVDKYSFYVLVVLLATFVFQFLSTLIFGEPINYHAIVGETPRLQNAVGYRTAGLFMEPTSYCAMMFMVISIRFLLDSYSKYELLGILSIPFSFSLYGLFLFFILLGFWFLKMLKRRFLIYTVLFFLILIIFALFLGQAILEEGSQLFKVVNRLSSISNDESTLYRYSLRDNFSFFTLMFGSGLSTEGGLRYGSFGLGYLLSGVGLIGLIILVFVSIDFYRKKLLFIFSILFVILLSSSYWTFLAFWMWLSWIYIVLKPSENLEVSSYIKA